MTKEFIRNSVKISLAFGVCFLVGSRQLLYAGPETQGNKQTPTMKIDYDLSTDAFCSEDNAFLDAPEDFKGKTIRFVGYYGLQPILPTLNLRQMSGSSAGFGPIRCMSSDAVIKVQIPKTLKLPNVSSGWILVTLKCTKGSLSDGNIAVSIDRPKE